MPAPEPPPKRGGAGRERVRRCFAPRLPKGVWEPGGSGGEAEVNAASLGSVSAGGARGRAVRRGEGWGRKPRRRERGGSEGGSAVRVRPEIPKGCGAARGAAAEAGLAGPRPVLALEGFCEDRCAPGSASPPPVYLSKTSAASCI